jgi:hypothetical protein
MDKEQAISATKTGAISAGIVALVTLAITFFAILNNSSGTLGYWNDPAIFFDFVVTSILAYGMYRKSLTAAVMMFIYFLLAKIFITMETGRPAGIVTGLIFLYIFGKAMQGAYVLKKIEKAENPGYPTKSNWMKFFIITGVVLFFSLAGLGMLTTTGTLTPTEVLEGKDLSKDYREALIRSEIINSGDSIQYFYSEAFSSIEETGSILTSDRVIMYLQDENKETAVYELYFEDITDVELTESGNFLNDSVYKVYADSRDAYLTIVLSTTDRGDIKFIEALRSELKPYR